VTDQPPVCACHGEAMYWQARARYTAGGYWRCAVKKRASNNAYHHANRERALQQRRDRYDRDAVYRLTKLMHDNARRRRDTIERRRQQLGSLPLEG
jgi:hypothetical protein